MKLKIYYNKLGQGKYLSQLDLVRFIERTFRRSNIQMIYSQGFNPRPKISFSNSIALGIEVERDYFFIEILDRDIDDIKGELNKNSIYFINFLEVINIDNLTKCFRDPTSDYIITGSNSNINILYELLNKEDIIQIKKNRRGNIKERNLKKNIKNITKNYCLINISLESISPSTFINHFELKQSNYNIKKLPVA